MRLFLASLVVLAGGGIAAAQGEPTPATAPAAVTTAAAEAPSPFFSEEDGWLDVSRFLDEKYGFLPIVVPITEPAVGYGAAGGLMFLSKPLGSSNDGFGRPSISVVAGLGTENGTWGAAIGDVRYWLEDRLQTQVAVMRASLNLDYFGAGDDPRLDDDPLTYDLDTLGGFAQAKWRLFDSTLWIGLGYALATTRVEFDTRDRVRADVPDFERSENVGAVIPSLTYDTRDNIFTPRGGTFIEVNAGLFSEYVGGDSDFQRPRLVAMQFLPLHESLTLGLRGDFAATFGSAPFFLQPFVVLRGVPAVRYQAEEMASAEAELRWQLWGRFSVVGFAGYGVVWNGFEDPEDTEDVVSGGGGIRYEIARAHGIHVGFDVAFSRDTAAFYIQVGSAWARP